MKFVVRVETNGKSKVAVLDRSQCKVGRERSELTLQDQFCSRVHAEFYANFDMSLWVRDLGSRNGIFLNGQRIRKARITKGDRIQIGTTLLTIVEEIVSVGTPDWAKAQTGTAAQTFTF